MYNQQSLRSDCPYTQSDQSLCLSLEYSMSVKLLTEHHLQFLILKGGCRGSSESTHVKMPHCWKSHVPAHRYLPVQYKLVLSFCFYFCDSLHCFHCKYKQNNEFNRPLVKSVYQKNNFLISQPKHMFWVLKRNISMRRFF